MKKLAKLIKKKTFVAIDLETTGLNSDPSFGRVDHVIAIGAAKIERGKITEQFHSFVACPVPLSPPIELLTGISNEDLFKAPQIDEALNRLRDFCNGYPLVGHNLPFDLGFLNYYGQKTGLTFGKKKYDTLALAKEILAKEFSKKTLRDYKLSTLAKYFQIPFEKFGAAEDALTAAKLFLALAKA